jgi:hypothetical protein
MVYDLVQIPLDYVPHISLQMFLHSLDSGSGPAVSAAWASVQLVSRVVETMLLMTKRNLCGIVLTALTAATPTTFTPASARTPPF